MLLVFSGPLMKTSVQPNYCSHAGLNRYKTSPFKHKVELLPPDKEPQLLALLTAEERLKR